MDWWRLARWVLLVVAVVGAVLLMGRVAVLAFRSHKGPTASVPFAVAVLHSAVFRSALPT